MDLRYERSFVFSEFSPEEQKMWFSYKQKAVSQHIDSLYYSVFIEGDCAYNDSLNMLEFLEELGSLKAQAATDGKTDVTFCELKVCAGGAGMGSGLYAYHLSKEEAYDIFVSPYLPNDDTPRIQVQLRTEMLVCEGVETSILDTYDKVSEILQEYGMRIKNVAENRIDYAFHTNCLQKPVEEFTDEYIRLHLVTPFSRMGKEYDLSKLNEDKLEVDYFTLGRRKSKKVFFRAYEKTKEVIQENYKAFFFDRWLERGLISEFDKFVYEEAYRLHSFNTGVLVGRIKWYLKYGKNPELKDELRCLLESCNVKSDNNKHIEKALKGVIPVPTVIMNIEFETKRKYYKDIERSIGLVDTEDTVIPEEDIRIETVLKERCYPTSLYRLFRIVGGRRKNIINHLTSSLVQFVETRHTDEELVMVDWWKRIHRTKIDDLPKNERRDVIYSYSHRLNAERVEHTVKKNVATLAIYSRGTFEETTFSDDLWDSITLLNDNDVHVSREDFENLVGNLQPKDYTSIQRKRSRQLKRIFKAAEREADKLEEVQKKEEKARCRICNGIFLKSELEDYNLRKGGGLCPECVKIPLLETLC